jgi:hypothetical protein
MGPVNPIAAEEFEETQKRQEHLDAQTKDLRRSERSLHKVIGLMDKQMGDKFMGIFDQVNESFQDVFLYMFPDGKAQLLLTDPDDPLATGIEIEAQPSGRRLKKVSRLRFISWTRRMSRWTTSICSGLLLLSGGIKNNRSFWLSLTSDGPWTLPIFCTE